jgi:hypothetical protein
VPKTIRIRVDDGVYRSLRRRAADKGIALPELLRAELTRLAARPSIDAWLTGPGTRRSVTPAAEVIHALDEIRGPWR